MCCAWMGAVEENEEKCRAQAVVEEVVGRGVCNFSEQGSSALACAAGPQHGLIGGAPSLCSLDA